MPTPLWFVLSTWPAEQDALYSVSSGYYRLLLLADSILPGGYFDNNRCATRCNRTSRPASSFLSGGLLDLDWIEPVSVVMVVDLDRGHMISAMSCLGGQDSVKL